MTRVIRSPRALDDLDAIEAYIAKDNPTAARRVIAKIIQRARRIEMFPESGGIVEEDDSHRYRQILQGNYRVVYRYEQPSATAYVITIIHAARFLDPDTLLRIRSERLDRTYAFCFVRDSRRPRLRMSRNSGE